MSIYRGAGGAGDAVADSSSEALLIRDLAIEVQADADAAAASATSSSGSASAAATSATSASNSATAAATSATNASNSASAASTSATNAANSATAAQTAETAAELAETNAETAETNAAASASAASSSASTASTQATNASNSATAAATSATNASNSASAASTSATNASTSATAAASSASSASTSASNAATSATNASNSATSASTSATTATTQAGIATTQATNASNSATAAATSATNASNSASAASTSESNAATSASTASSAASAALSALDSFDDRYLGAKSTAPTLDNDGDPLIAGALYFDTVSNTIKVYTGTIWVDAYADGNTFLAKANNLSDLQNTSTARTNLGLAIGTNVQAWDADLDTWATKTAPTGTVVGTSDTQTLTNKTLTSPVVTGGSINNTPIGASTPSTGSFTSLTDSGNLTFTGTGNRILGDFSNATIANRVSFQTSTTNGVTSLGLIPNGSATAANFSAYSNSGVTDAQRAQLACVGGSDVRIVSDFIGSGSFLPLTMFTGGSERLRIDTSGRVGIGLTSPVALLDVNGKVIGRQTLANNGASSFSAFAAGNAQGQLAGMALYPTFVGTGDNGPRRAADVWAGFNGGNWGTQYLAFGVGNAGNDAQDVTPERMRIDASGRLLVGTNTNVGDYKAQIAHSSGELLALRATSGTLTRIAFENAASSFGNTQIIANSTALAFVTGSAERMRINSAGRVGIGRDAGTQNLEVLNSAAVYAASGQTGVISIYSNGQTATELTFGQGTYSVNDNIAFMWNRANAALAFATNNTERMRVEANGNVAIGTTSGASQRLEVNNGSAAITTPLAVANNISGIAIARAGINFNAHGVNFANITGGQQTDNTFGDGTLIFATRSAEVVAERMRIDSSGNLLVGATSQVRSSSVPSVQIANNADQLLIRNTGATAGLHWRYTCDNNNTVYIINHNTNGVYIGNGGTSWLSLSDERHKDIIEPITNAAEKISTLRAVIGKYKKDEEGTRRSFLIAQDVQAVLPEAVFSADPEQLGLSYTDTIPLLVAAIQELKATVDAQAARIAVLESK